MKDGSDLGFSDVFSRLLRFLPPLTTGRHNLASKWQKMMTGKMLNSALPKSKYLTSRYCLVEVH